MTDDACKIDGLTTIGPPHMNITTSSFRHKYYDWPNMMKGISGFHRLIRLTQVEEANSMVQLYD